MITLMLFIVAMLITGVWFYKSQQTQARRRQRHAEVIDAVSNTPALSSRDEPVPVDDDLPVLRAERD